MRPKKHTLQYALIDSRDRLTLNTFHTFCRYDRQRLVLKEIHNCQYITCMNPTAGSFSINPRLQVAHAPSHLSHRHTRITLLHLTQLLYLISSLRVFTKSLINYESVKLVRPWKLITKNNTNLIDHIYGKCDRCHLQNLKTHCHTF